MPWAVDPKPTVGTIEVQQVPAPPESRFRAPIAPPPGLETLARKLDVEQDPRGRSAPLAQHLGRLSEVQPRHAGQRAPLHRQPALHHARVRLAPATVPQIVRRLGLPRRLLGGGRLEAAGVEVDLRPRESLQQLLHPRGPLLQLLVQIRGISPFLLLDCIWIRHV